MFIGYYQTEGKENFNLYYNCIEGWDLFHSDTFSPETKNIKILQFKINGKNYQERKENLKDLAIDYQLNFSTLSWSYGEIATIQYYFYTNARRYGLIKEFKENCII